MFRATFDDVASKSSHPDRDDPMFSRDAENSSREIVFPSTSSTDEFAAERVSVCDAEKFACLAATRRIRREKSSPKYQLNRRIRSGARFRVRERIRMGMGWRDALRSASRLNRTRLASSRHTALAGLLHDPTVEVFEHIVSDFVAFGIESQR